MMTEKTKKNTKQKGTTKKILQIKVVKNQQLFWDKI